MRLCSSTFFNINNDWIFPRPAHPDPRYEQKVALYRLYNQLNLYSRRLHFQAFFLLLLVVFLGLQLTMDPCHELIRKAVWQHLDRTSEQHATIPRPRDITLSCLSFKVCCCLWTAYGRRFHSIYLKSWNEWGMTGQVTFFSADYQ